MFLNPRQASNEHQESAKGAELLLLGTLLQQYCSGDDENVDNGALEVCLHCVYYAQYAHCHPRPASMLLHA